LTQALRRVRLAAFDVDGVFTDGRFLLLSDGRDAVAFDTRDGLGVRMLLDAGIPVALVTGRVSDAVKLRAERLGIPHLVRGSGDKAADLAGIAGAEGIALDQVLFMGDDLPDLPAFRAAGVAVSVPGAPAEVRAAADLVTERSGGKGAVREVAEMILRAQEKYESSIRRLTGDPG
jgi:3-deoxy-D-manno-octulosonate 8-phosphate phosphatase (KDO 8-P phosphatase)